jgi:hypothetical protein
MISGEARNFRSVEMEGTNLAGVLQGVFHHPGRSGSAKVENFRSSYVHMDGARAIHSEAARERSVSERKLC